MARCYILFSKKLNKYYIGSTDYNADQRLLKHLSIHKGYTSTSNDWIIVYQEFFKDKLQALKKEKLIKSWKNRKLIEKLIQSSTDGSEHPD